MKFENQAAINNSIKTLKSTFSRYNNWVAKEEYMNAARDELKARGRDFMSQEEEKAFWQAYNVHKDRRPSNPNFGGEMYKAACDWVPRRLKEEHGIVIQNSPSNGGYKATALEILAVFGVEV